MRLRASEVIIIRPLLWVMLPLNSRDRMNQAKNSGGKTQVVMYHG